jgi:UDP-N-acetylmuramate--alanine ligase
VTAALEMGVDHSAIREGLQSFTGAGRRFEFLGSFNGVTVADDYAHHPAELAATLRAAKKMGYNRVIAVFQPFTYSRTYLLLDEFAEALSLADIVVMTEIMGSREKNTYGIYTADLAAKIPGSIWFNTFEEVVAHVQKIAHEGDLVLTLGCGDIYKAAHMLLK